MSRGRLQGTGLGRILRHRPISLYELGSLLLRQRSRRPRMRSVVSVFVEGGLGRSRQEAQGQGGTETPAGQARRQGWTDGTAMLLQVAHAYPYGNPGPRRAQ